MPEISQSTKKLISQYQFWHKSLQPKEGEATIHVDEVASTVAAFYEKIRGVIDWQDEHLLRKRAIERNLKRRLFLNENKKKIAESLILELIRGGHFANDFIPEIKIKEVQNLIDKYVYILKNNSSSAPTQNETLFDNWILGIAACELEEILAPSIREKALIEYMTDMIRQRIKCRTLKEEEINMQTYIAVQRALFKLDSNIISYNLLKKRYSEWLNPSPDLLKKIAEDIYFTQEKIEKDLEHPLADKFYKICEKYDTPYLILGDILSADPLGAEKIIYQPEILEEKIHEAYGKRVGTIKSRLNRAAFYATLSIFITNVFSLFIIEVPLAKLLWGEFTPLSIVINIFGPTLLMFFLIITIKLPPKENADVVIMEITKIIYNQKKKDTYGIKVYPKNNFIKTIISLFYITGFILFCIFISWGLSKIDLPPSSHIVFIVFLSLIAFAGTKIRQKAKEIEIIERKDSFFYFFVDLFAVPLTHFGKIVSGRWKKINIISKIFTMLIDMPFQLFVEFLEQWRYFLKERKDEIH